MHPPLSALAGRCSVVQRRWLSHALHDVSLAPGGMICILMMLAVSCNLQSLLFVTWQHFLCIKTNPLIANTPRCARRLSHTRPASGSLAAASALLLLVQQHEAPQQQLTGGQHVCQRWQPVLNKLRQLSADPRLLRCRQCCALTLQQQQPQPQQGQCQQRQRHNTVEPPKWRCGQSSTMPAAQAQGSKRHPLPLGSRAGRGRGGAPGVAPPAASPPRPARLTAACGCQVSMRRDAPQPQWHPKSEWPTGDAPGSAAAPPRCGPLACR